jgi:hypothetical protein
MTLYSVVTRTEAFVPDAKADEVLIYIVKLSFAGGSFNGRTPDSDSVNQGSNPCPPAIFLLLPGSGNLSPRVPKRHDTVKYRFVRLRVPGIGAEITEPFKLIPASRCRVFQAFLHIT